MTTPPLITIGITCFQARDTIAKAIQSALDQDWPNFEVIVVDDCSEDDSVEIIKSLISGINNARLIRHEINTGPAASRNTILSNASGEFLAFFDDDDISLPSRIRVQLNQLKSYELRYGVNLIACYASGVRRYSNGYELEISAIGSRYDIPKGEVVADYLLFNSRRSNVFYGGGTPTCSLMARTTTFLAVEGFDSSLRRVEDVDFAIRLAMAGGHFIGCKDLLYIQNATLALDKSPFKNFEAELRMVEKNELYLKSKNRYDYSKSWFRIRYYHFSQQRIKFVFALMVFLIKFPAPGIKHFMHSAPRRLAHELKMFRRAS
ncbi:glycosyltransferase family 2 protein [Mesorhizobium japonicum]|uniref:glycosyltransferase family 2 protein n=1 Tax=Mesorhizobium japonicum TaxID=2066070 RepID=UPI003B5B55E9